MKNEVYVSTSLYNYVSCVYRIACDLLNSNLNKKIIKLNKHM